MERNIYLTADRFPLIRDVGAHRTEGWYTHPDRVLDYDVFLFVIDGMMRVIEEGTAYEVGKNQYLFLKQGLHHWGHPDTLPGTSWYWLHFNRMLDERAEYGMSSALPELTSYFPEHYQYKIPMPKFGEAAIQPTVEEQLLSMLNDYRAPRPHRMTDISLQAYRLFLSLHHHAAAAREAAKPPRKAEFHARRIMAYLSLHAEEEFDSGRLSAYMNMNYSHLSATFAKHTGRTIVEAHTRLRMNKALELMRTTTLNVSEISERLGYQNPFYFTRVFKKMLGEPPTSYMRHFYRSP